MRKLKRIVAGITAFVFLFTSGFQIKESNAVVPLLFGAAVQSSAPLIIQATAAAEVAVAGAMTGYALEKVGAIDALGKVFDRLAFYVNGNSDQPALVVPLDPKAKKKIPEGWTAPPSGQTDPVPPSTSSYSLVYRSGYQGFNYPLCNGKSSIGELASCILALNGQGSQYHYVFYIQGGPRDASGNWPNNGSQYCTDKVSNEYCAYAANSEGQVVWSLDVVSYSSAPDGYGNCTSSGCSLTNASAVKYPSDGECQLSLVSGQFAPDPRDPDCNGGSSTIAPGKGISITPGKVSVASAGRRVTEITTDPVSGVVRITDTYPDAATGTTKTSVVEIDPPIAGAPASSAPVAGVSVNSTQGTGSLASNVAVPYAPSSTPSIQFPTDYNREATQLEMLDQLKKISANANAAAPNSNVAVPSESIYKTAYPEETLSTVFDKFKTDISAAPFYSKAIGFVSLGDIGSGSCSGLNTNLNLMGESIEIDVETILCSQMAMGVYQVLAIGVKIAFVVAAFSIAIL